MGQQQSQEHHHHHDLHLESPSSQPDLHSIEQEIERVRQELEGLKQEGQTKQQQYKDELDICKSQLDDSVQRFCECDRDATSVFQFWDYLDVIRQEEDKEQREYFSIPAAAADTTTSSSPSPTTIPSSSSWSPGTTTTTTNASSSSSSNANTNKPSVTTLAKTSLSAITTQFCIDLIRFFQAHLLRKIHMAVMLETQRKKQARGWNKLVLFLYRKAQDNNTCGDMRKASQRASETLKQGQMHQQEKQDLISRILNMQQELLDKLSQSPSSSSKSKRRSSIEDIRQSKRELEVLRYSISPSLQPPRKVVDVTIQMMAPTLSNSISTDSAEEYKEDREERPEMDHGSTNGMRRRPSIQDIKARTRQLEENRPKTDVSPTNSSDGMGV